MKYKHMHEVFFRAAMAARRDLPASVCMSELMQTYMMGGEL